jgi:phospholipid/cholesterol/gamma-HCH transport system substrate-binding protein
MKRAIREHWKDFAAIVGLLAVALSVSAVILSNQRFHFPFTAKPVRMYAELPTAQGVTPGQGQQVTVAGVTIGRIEGVELRGGRALVELGIFPRYRDLVRTDASALLRPRTGLKDMFLQVDPGTRGAPAAGKGFTMPVSRTLSDVDVDQILASLDGDTRDHLQLLLAGTAKGLEGRGPDLAELFRRFGPTARDLRRVNQAVALEREGLKDAIHGLSQVASELGGKSDDLARLVDASASVFQALASEDRGVSATVAKLPAALRTTTETLGKVRAFAQQLGPASEALTPAFEELDGANAVLRPVATALTPVLRDRIRPFVRQARPLVADLRPAATGLGAATPDLTSAFTRVNHFFNLLAFNRDGREGPDKASRDEGYLFWTAWLAHQTANLINIDDANGPMRPIFLTGTCETLINLVNGEPALEFLMGLSGILADKCGNPQTTSVDTDKVKRLVARDAKTFDARLKRLRTLGAMK